MGWAGEDVGVGVAIVQYEVGSGREDVVVGIGVVRYVVGGR